MDGPLFNPDDGKQPKTFGLNILIFNLLALYIYLLLTEFKGRTVSYGPKKNKDL